MTIEVSAFPDTSALDDALASAIAGSLRKGIAATGRAAIAVSGGRTPGGFFRALSHQELDWNRVTITLADERCVDETDPSSNARSVRENLLQGPASAANFLPLYLRNERHEALLQRLCSLPSVFDAVVLGMGDDSHTASIFPDSPQRDAALALDAPDALEAEGKAPVIQRITLSARRLLATRQLIVHITGAGKWQLLGAAIANPGPERPISFFLNNRTTPAHVFWTL